MKFLSGRCHSAGCHSTGDLSTGAGRSGACHGMGQVGSNGKQGTRSGTGILRGTGVRKLAIVGSPNVGKSVIFNNLTGAYVTVSNYPGTTVEVSRGRATILGKDWEVVDTPGMYSLLPITEEERVTRRLLLDERPDVVLHVVDGKNLERMVALTLQLIEAGLPVVLDVNIMDEAERIGMRIDLDRLEKELGVPVVGTVSTIGRGMDVLRRKVSEMAERCAERCIVGNPAGVGSPPGTGSSSRAPAGGAQGKPISGIGPRRVPYGNEIESAINSIEPKLRGNYGLSKRSVALLLLQGDEEVQTLVRAKEGVETCDAVFGETHVEAWGKVLHGAGHDQVLTRNQVSEHDQPLSYVLALRRHEAAAAVVAGVVAVQGNLKEPISEKFSRLTMNPITGTPILLIVLYYGLYKFVGVFGAGTVVDFLESTVFGRYVTPFVNNFVDAYIPYAVLRELIAKDYGIITLGLRYAFAIILPIVGTFFIAFSVIEDSGYLPRLAMLVDRLFKVIGLNGRAVIPMTLGFGCDTMATVVTRTLETRRERVISTLLLALAIPCSAQLGVILALLSGSPRGLLVWAGFVGLIFLLVGYLTSRIVPGDRPSFYMEVPPLRVPSFKNVLTKTYARMKWYLAEVLPLFVTASILIWIGRLTGAFQMATNALKPLVTWIGLPEDAAAAFLFGFFRRDYGAAGLFDLQRAGLMSGVQLVVAAATLTLFVPCIAQFSIMLKERGPKTTMAIVLFIFPFAFVAGFMINLVLMRLGVVL